MKSPSPLLGYNNNVRHKGRVFHIQTEDSGVHHPHIITHLFTDGGRIVRSLRGSYADHLGAPAVAEIVRKMMKAQHKAMLVSLRNGDFDHLVRAPMGPDSPATVPFGPGIARAQRASSQPSVGPVATQACIQQRRQALAQLLSPVVIIEPPVARASEEPSAHASLNDVIRGYIVEELASG